jgi:beta-lactamase superfamily II metal-dependent hydrolase
MCAVLVWASVVLLDAQRDSGAGFLRISFIDVGQGDAIWIQGPDEDDGTRGGNVIIDGGPDRGPGNRVIQYLQSQRYGLQKGQAIDCIIATHPHDDHYPGLMDVLAQYEVRWIIDSGYPKERTTETGKPSKFELFRQAALKERADGRPSRFVELRRQPGFAPTCGNVNLRLLHSNAKDIGPSGNTRENNASTVIKLTFGAFSFLFVGDAEGKERKDKGDTAEYVEAELLAKAKSDPGLLRATVLKVGHHGSETSSSLPFIRAVRPDVIVIMSGRKAFGGTYLPDQSVLTRYRKENPHLTVVRTDADDARERRDTTNDQDGDDVYMYTDGDTLRINRAVGPVGRRRWQLVKTLQAP